MQYCTVDEACIMMKTAFLPIMLFLFHWMREKLDKAFFPCSSRHILRRSNTAIMQKVQTVFHSWALTQQCCSFQISTQFEMRIIIASTGAQAQVRRSVFQIGGAPIRGRKLLGVGGRSPRKKFSSHGQFSFGNIPLWMLKGNFMFGGP